MSWQINNRYSSKRLEVIRLGTQIEQVGISPKVEADLSWQDFWLACDSEIKEYAYCIMYRKVRKCGFSGQKQSKLKKELKSLLIQYVLGIE